MRNKGWTPNPKSCTWACKGMSTLTTLYFYFIFWQKRQHTLFLNKKKKIDDISSLIQF